MLRIAAELQLGLGGINWRQPAITQFFKPTLKEVKTRIKRTWADIPTNMGNTPKNKKKTNIDPLLLKKNRNLTVHNVFVCSVQTDETVYWEFNV